MKIAIPVNLDQKSVCASFGRTPFYLFYNTETKEKDFFDNSALESQGGAGIKAAQILLDNKIDVLLTPRCGENAAKVLVAGGVAMYSIKSLLAQEAIEDYLKGNLSELTEIHAGFHHHGGR